LVALIPAFMALEAACIVRLISSAPRTLKELAVELWNKAAKYQAEAAKLDNRKLPDIGNLPLWLRRSAYCSRGPQESRLKAWLS
jgi:hypothetical protein